MIVYDGWKPTMDDDQWNGWSWNIYGAGADEILYRHDVLHGDLRYHLDRMGNVAFVLDSDGDGIEKYTYDAFGKPTVTTWSGTSPRSYSWYGNRFMFNGREYLSELGIYDFRSRMYSSGRFLQKDPLGFGGGDANLFRYCGDDPVNRRDPSGLRPDPRFNSEGIDSGALGDWNLSLGSSNSGSISTQGFWSTPGGFPTGLGGGASGGDSNQGGGRDSGSGGSGGSNAASNTISSGYTDIYVVNKDTYELVNVIVAGWWDTPGMFPSGGMELMWFTGIDANSRLARATNWLAANHPELNPRQHQPVLGPVKNGDGGYNWKPWTSQYGQITIDPTKNSSDGEYVAALAHELLHAQTSLWGNAWAMAYEPDFDPLGYHLSIYLQGNAIATQYYNQYGR